jgi:predicted nucleic acid-binding protein
MIVTLDVSAAVEVLLNRGNASTLREGIERADTVIAPEIFVSEIANVAWKYNRIGSYSYEQSVSLAEDGISLVDHFISTQELWKESLRESINANHPVCDAVYAICARRNDGRLLTVDKRLMHLCENLHIESQLSG